jgi:chromosome partitioning protein
MGKIIAFSNQKGGIGKTTSAVNIAAAVAKSGKKVLLCDFDPQGNATSGVGISKKGTQLTSYDLLTGKADAKDTIIQTNFDNLWVMPTNIGLAGAEYELVTAEKREFVIRDALASIKDEFDYIMIDCPPSLGILTVGALSAADGVLIPMVCEYYALEGLSQLMLTIRQVKKRYNPALEITGILLTMFDKRLNLTMQVKAELEKYYKDKLFETTIVRNVRLSEAPSYGMPVIYYDKSSKGAVAYTAVAKELTERI